MSSGLPADLRAAAALGGETGRRLEELDWTAHPLGDPAGWPTAVRAEVAAALASRFPIVLWLGEPLYLVYNDAYIPMLGDKHPAALGQPAAQVWWDIWDVVGPMLASVVDSGVATWSDDLMLMLVNDGRRQERYFTFTYSPIIGSGGQVEGVFCAVTETTERVLGERRLRALNALSAALLDVQYPDAALEAAVEVCAAHDADLPFAAVYRTSGPLEQARAHRVTPTAAGLPDSLALLLDGARPGQDGAYLATDLPSRFPGLRDRFQPDWCPQQALVIPVSEPAGHEPGAALVLGLNGCRPLDEQYRGFCGLLADQVSAALAGARAYEDERRRAEALAELDAAKTTFLQNVSHEFRTPLTLMLGPLEDLIAAHAGDGEAEQLEMIRRNGQRLLRLVNSLLDFSRIEAGRASPDLAVTDVGSLTAAVASSFTEACRLADIELVTRCQPAWALADAAMWETIVVNLVSNAVKHTFTGSVTVMAGPALDGGIEVRVADTGTGIAAADLPRLFERFYRAASTAGRSTEGAGIGLALVKSLTEMHGGTVTVDSALGAGTTVTVRLPPAAVRQPGAAAGGTPPAAGGTREAYADEATRWTVGQAAARSPEGEQAGERGRALVLIADDNADMRAHLVRVLGARWDVVAAADGGQALELTRRLRPDLLVADVMMPVLDGFGLITAIRADPGLAALPVVILSARAGVEAAGEGLAAGADDYLVKPFSAADLVNRVAARLETAGRDKSRRDGLLARRDQALAGLAAALAEARTAEQALHSLLASPLCCLEASSAAAGLLDEARVMLRMTFAGDIRGEFTDRYHLISLDAPVPIAKVAGSDETLAVPDITRLDRRYRQAAADAAPDVQATIIHPLHDGDGTVIGALALNWAQPRAFTSGEVEATRRAAAMLARALVRITAAERQHQVAIALQEHLLDLGAGTPAAVVAAAYQPAGQALQVGGDWYTATPLDDRRTGVSVGDVAGHGLPAAAVMSQLRSALGAVALGEADPAAVLGQLDRYARGIPEAMFATAAYAIIDTPRGTVDYSCAGHPYPLIVTPDGNTRYLTDGRRAPLGARAAAIHPATGHDQLPAGSMLLLYTDGLIERRGEPIDAGMARLAQAAARCARQPASVACAALLEAMVGPGGYDDDVAMVAVRPCGTTPGSHVDAIPAAFTEMAPARGRLRGWLRHAAPDPAQAGAILHCAGEAVANAIEHGSDCDPDRIVTIEAFAAPDAVTVTVGDTGHWAKDPSASRMAGRGYGLTLLHGLADHVHIARTPRGTRVTITCRVTRPAAATAAP